MPGGGAPDGAAAVLATIDEQREAVRGWAERELKRLDRAAVALGGEASPAAPPPAPSEKPKPRAKRKAVGSSPEAAKQRRERIMEFVEAQDGQVAPRQIREELGISENSMRTAAAKLIEEGRLKRHGERQFTVYEAASKAGGPPAPGPPPPGPPPVPTRQVGGGTLQGRVLAKVQETGFATLEELIEHTGEDHDAVLRECGLLIRENEIRMERREGKPGYVPAA